MKLAKEKWQLVFFLFTSFIFGIDYDFNLLFVLSIKIASIFSLAHIIRLLICGSKDVALSVREYSTLGGTSAYTCLLTKPSSSRVLKVTVSIFCEMSGIFFCKALKRISSD
jgi:hypothetical protein